MAFGEEKGWPLLSLQSGTSDKGVGKVDEVLLRARSTRLEKKKYINCLKNVEGVGDQGRTLRAYTTISRCFPLSSFEDESG